MVVNYHVRSMTHFLESTAIQKASGLFPLAYLWILMGASIVHFLAPGARVFVE